MPRRETRSSPFARLALLAGLLGSMVSSACVAPGQLVARDGTHRLVARDDVSGVTVVLTTEAWEGESYIANDLTVVHVLISNLSSQAVLLAPGDFELVDSRGFTYELRDTGARFRQEGEPDRPYDPGQSLSFQGISGGELARLALPWGILAPGTQMRGFLYFENMENRANHAELIWHAESPSHQTLADFSFPLSVSRSFEG